MGRIDSGDVFQDDKVIYPSGYILGVQADGAWKLISTAYKKPPVSLANGSLKLSAGWHHFALTFSGAKITATLDGTQLASVNDSSHTHGMFALGTGWNKAQFDNLAVTK